jgi:hypothetical protein
VAELRCERLEVGDDIVLDLTLNEVVWHFEVSKEFGGVFEEGRNAARVNASNASRFVASVTLWDTSYTGV